MAMYVEKLFNIMTIYIENYIEKLFNIMMIYIENYIEALQPQDDLH